MRDMVRGSLLLAQVRPLPGREASQASLSRACTAFQEERTPLPQLVSQAEVCWEGRAPRPAVAQAGAPIGAGRCCETGMAARGPRAAGPQGYAELRPQSPGPPATCLQGEPAGALAADGVKLLLNTALRCRQDATPVPRQASGQPPRAAAWCTPAWP